MPIFNDENIERLFGAEAAEDENPDRLKEYFYINKTYENIRNNMSIRVLVGHKGIGKSALLKRSYIDDIDNGRLCVWIQPTDLTELSSIKDTGDFNQQIDAWKRGILRVVAKKVIDEITGGNSPVDLGNAIFAKASTFIGTLIDTLQRQAEKYIPNSNQAIVKQFLSEKIVHIYLDDIDRGWAALDKDIKGISALLNAIRDISSEEKGLRFRVGLRTDVYFLVRTSDESTDKIENNIIWLTWSNHEILSLAAKRIETFFKTNLIQEQIDKMDQRKISDQILSKVIEPRFIGKGHWSDRPIHNVILSLVRKRPRDLVKLMSGAAKIAYSREHQIITSKDLDDSFTSYSEERLQDTINEFKTEMPSINKLLLGMRPTKIQRKASENYVYSTDKLSKKLTDIMRGATLSFTNGRNVYGRSLIQFLYKIDFVTARKEDGEYIDRKYFEQARFLANEVVDFGYDWEVHPAYRWALQPQDVNDVINSLRNYKELN
jgi:hypothetical protein